jgi:hypothetical protein
MGRGRGAAGNNAAPPPPFVPPLVALSYDVAELDTLIERHFDGCSLVGFGAPAGGDASANDARRRRPTLAAPAAPAHGGGARDRAALIERVALRAWLARARVRAGA